MKGEAFKCRKMKVNSLIWSKNLNNSIELRHTEPPQRVQWLKDICKLLMNLHIYYSNSIQLIILKGALRYRKRTSIKPLRSVCLFLQNGEFY